MWAEPLQPRPHRVNGLAVHQRCYRLLTNPAPALPLPLVAAVAADLT